MSGNRLQSQAHSHQKLSGQESQAPAYTCLLCKAHAISMLHANAKGSGGMAPKEIDALRFHF